MSEIDDVESHPERALGLNLMALMGTSKNPFQTIKVLK
jgi:hypothetical protein